MNKKWRLICMTGAALSFLGGCNTTPVGTPSGHVSLVGPAGINGYGMAVDSSAEGFTVSKVYANSPARAAGVEEGCVIRRIDGRLMDGYSFYRFTEWFFGETGSVVRITAEMSGKTRSYDVSIGIFYLPEGEYPYYMPTYEFEFCREVLEIFYIFQQELPDSPYVYSYPDSLYSRAINDPYTIYFNKELAEKFLVYLTTRTAGIGIRVSFKAGDPVIIDVIPNSPAQDAGLQVGDTIFSIDGTVLWGLPYNEIMSLLAGDEGDAKDLGIRRESGELVITAVLGEFYGRSVYVDHIDDAIAYIALTEFSDNTCIEGGTVAEFSHALDSTAWAEFTILDLRDNPGGGIVQCIGVASEFVPAGTPIVRARERQYDFSSGESYEIDSTWNAIEAGAAIDRKYYVLMNGNTASAAEILIACLHAGRADIVSAGTTTYGKGRGQRLLDTPDEGLAKVTYATIDPVLGEPYDGIGIEPRITVDPGEDALAVALAHIEGASARRLVDAGREARGRIGAITEMRKFMVKPWREPLGIVRGPDTPAPGRPRASRDSQERSLSRP